ncbi:hypothetical protein NECAME_16984 [Necator americanus]|uniref:Uncharacterized protein n=1 Tax=Necator americanus TaxID=51031 RepID=W2TS36_NECAM|nr:hypothetical protein NECAME_16984 [Necator americanus]ETN84865.1 hypothetical protein NECAME_16984 [Necator americanus]
MLSSGTCVKIEKFISNCRAMRIRTLNFIQSTRENLSSDVLRAKKK